MINRIRAFLDRQPRPLSATTAYLRTPGVVVSSIARHWRPGDSGPAGTCRLCDRCVSKDDLCLIVVGRYVPSEDAAMFSTVGMKRQGP